MLLTRHRGLVCGNRAAICGCFRDGRDQQSRSRIEGLRYWIQADHSARRSGAVACVAHSLDSRKRTRDMIQPLRRSHLWIWIVLAVLLPVLFAAGLAARRDTTPNNPDVHWEQYK